METRLELGEATRPPPAPTFVFDRHHRLLIRQLLDLLVHLIILWT
jgi:hypothetical protein